MTRISVSRVIPTSPATAWEAIADLGSHQHWMRDARSVVFTTERRRGVGTRMEVETSLGPLRTVDVIEVTGWDEGSSVEVAHRGLIHGAGKLKVSEVNSGTLVTWTEDLAFPWWLGGQVTAWLARPVLKAVWRGNLARLQEGLTSP